ncbi:MAG: aspartate dehydrogenase [candidate division WOR-3 bacterium]
MRFGIIGCGAIGSFIAQEVDGGKVENLTLEALFDINFDKAKELAEKLKKEVRICRSIEEFLNLNLNLVLESASQEALKSYAFKIIDSGSDLVVMSAGALADDDFRTALFEYVKRKNRKLYVPSGAVAGLDGLKAFSNVKINKASLITRKPPAGLSVSGKGPEVLFEGSPKEAAVKFPQNINVAIALGLAGDMLEKLKVKIISDPDVNFNEHNIEVESEAGELRIVLRNKPFPQNPKTSFLAALSCLEMLKSISRNIIIGG